MIQIKLFELNLNSVLFMRQGTLRSADVLGLLTRCMSRFILESCGSINPVLILHFNILKG